jgi:hypothetical protein
MWWIDLKRFHITFFLGLFYHLADPVFVLRRAASLTQELMIVDTEILQGDESMFKILPRDPQEPTTCQSNVDSKIRLVPTRRALCDLLSDAGFSIIQCLTPDSGMPPEYLSGDRLTIVARKA